MGSGIIASNSLECESESLYSGQIRQAKVLADSRVGNIYATHPHTKLIMIYRM